MNLMPHSIRWRLQLWHGLLLFAVLAAFGITAWRLEWIGIVHSVDEELQPLATAALGALHRPAGGNRPLPREIDALFSPFPRMPDEMPLPPEIGDWIHEGPEIDRYACMWSPRGEVIMRGGKYAEEIDMPERTGNADLGSQGRTRLLSNGITVRELFVFTPPGDCVLIGRSLQPEFSEINAKGWKLGGFGLSVWIAGLLIGGWATTRALRPLKDISTTAARIADGHLDERIAVENTESELGVVAGVLNDTFERLQHSFEKQAQFSADAAHELRTPLSVVLSQAQLALSRERDPQDYKDALAACERAAKRMQSLTESLLQLSRFDAKAEPLQLERTDLAHVAKDVVEMVQPLADERQVRIALDCSHAICRGDSEQLAQVLINLTTNALHHSADGSLITVTTGTKDGNAFASVKDQGPGIAPQHLPQLFDRFYRADASRNRNTGGAGLGLAICKAIMTAHSGRIEASSEVGVGSEFTITVPALS